MLLLSKSRMEELCNKADAMDTSPLDCTFGLNIIDEFKTCVVEFQDEVDASTFKTYIRGLTEIVTTVLDPRLVCFESLIHNTYENIMHFDNSIILTPLCLIMRKYMNKDNYFLQLQHKIKTHTVGDNVAIDAREVTDSMFYLNSINLFPIKTLESYVASITTSAMTYAGNPMGYCGQTENYISSIGDNRTHQSSFSNVAIPDNLILRNCDCCSEYESASVDELFELLRTDAKTLISANGDSWFYGKNFVHSYINQYIISIDAVIRSRTDVLARIIKILNLTTEIYRQHHHALTAMVIVWLATVLRNENVHSSNGLNLKYLVDIELNTGKIFAVKVDNPSLSCDVFKLIVMVEDSLCIFKKRSDDLGLRDITSDAEQGVTLTPGVITDVIDRDDSVSQSACEYYRIEQTTSQLTRALTESFEVLKDGTIKVVLKSKTTYMDEYATNHRLLKYNDQQDDVEGMKYNLVYAMLLVESIDKNVLHNPKVKKGSTEYNEAEKAKSFALNDISTYLPKVRKYDRKFDLNRFYAKVKADRCTIEIDAPQTISGVKKIIQAIMV